MADTKSKNGRDSLRDWSFAVAAGAGSAFDITGMRMLDSDLLGADGRAALGPPDRVATDVARVMRSFGRSAQYAARALVTSDGTGDGRVPARSDDSRIAELRRDSD